MAFRRPGEVLPARPRGQVPARPGEAVRAASIGSALAVAAVLAGGVAIGSDLSQIGPTALILAVAAGLPHGAADLALILRRKGSRILQTVWLVGYATVAALAVGLALAVPAPAVAALLLLSVAHFAEGEMAFDRLRGGQGDPLSALAVATAAVGVPFVAHADEVRRLLAELSPGLADTLLTGPGLIALAAVVSGVVIVGVAAGSWRLRAEIALVAALAVAVAPLVSFAIWFAGWHAVRHTARLRATGSTWSELALVSALPTLGGAALLLALSNSLGATPAVLVGLMALTVPHTAVVLGMGAGQQRG